VWRDTIRTESRAGRASRYIGVCAQKKGTIECRHRDRHSIQPDIHIPARKRNQLEPNEAKTKGRDKGWIVKGTSAHISTRRHTLLRRLPSCLKTAYFRPFPRPVMCSGVDTVDKVVIVRRMVRIVGGAEADRAGSLTAEKPRMGKVAWWCVYRC